ncbi:RNA polymerase sigma factor (sigma-70 family) [Kribbella amoyensis]|uniref:RNA polymerase sigma factor (Sigma-70 family) n=1 Tax=Kribbella amoyensis TaxID=996641 RepID=A0A561C007_9ACTN|nr:sigma factor-like helix-turn-helix DNA-binding protein [Kribbella amoyensis]TWD84471.1 RNA polymerase sigma factor (sigma-70 family) [Kribbella amoyensis]
MNGDFRKFAVRRERALYRYAHLLTGDHTEAEELTRDALGRTQATWRRHSDTAGAELYARRAITTATAGRWRPRTWFADRTRAGHPAVPAHDNVAADSWIRDEVQSLPPRQRAALVLRYYERLTDAEVAQILGCSVPTARARTSQALDTLRSRLDPETAHLVDQLLTTRGAG